jgi:hypothetical protein
MHGMRAQRLQLVVVFGAVELERAVPRAHFAWSKRAQSAAALSAKASSHRV